MNSQALGGGVMLAVGAALWALYFLPIWTKRRKFAAAQQNALRIQRTLRMLAETAELPEEIRVEATAREALAHERLLEATGRSQLAEHEAKLAQAKLAERQALAEAKANRRRTEALKRELIRRSRGVRIARLITASIAALAFVGLVVGIVLAILGLGATLLGLSAAALLLGVGALVVMAPKQAVLTLNQSEFENARSVATTPQVESQRAQPKPSAQRQMRVQARPPASARVAPATETVTQPAERDLLEAKRVLELARSQAERMQREAVAVSPARDVAASHLSRNPKRPSLPATGVEASALRNMGVIDEIEAPLPDLDAVLQRRRAAS